MDANTMKFAMEQMSKMDPNQLQQMMQNLPPDALNHAMAQMKDMKPEDWERAKRQMAGMDADTMARQAAQAQAQLAGRSQYIMNASNQLKQEGNVLHNAGSYKEAVEKYERAKSNVESFTSTESRDLIRACTLNLSSCYLNLKQYAKCVEQCNQVLSGEPDNLKALYRRGQAYMGSAAWLEASADLERAVRLAAGTDPSQAKLIREKLQEVKDQIGALRASGKLPPAAATTDKPAAGSSAVAAAAAPGSAAGAGASRVEANAEASTSGSRPAGGASPMADPDMLARASEVMRNPEMLKQAQEMMRGMSDEQLRGMARHMGVDVPAEVMRSGLGDVNPDLMVKVAQLQSELPPDLRGPDAARNPEAMKRVADLMARRPDMAATMGQVLSSMDPSKLQEMAKVAGLPSGVTITPEMAKAAAESFQRMKPEDVQAAVEAASRMPQPPVPAAAAGPSSSAATSSVLPGAAGMPPMDPRQAADMLAAMTPEQLSAMTKMVPGGDKLALTPEMAKMAADMMKNMTPEDIERMQQMAAAMQGGVGGAAGLTAGPAVPSAAAAAAAAGGGSTGMAQMAADMMKNMTPEDMAKMQEMASKMGMGGPGGMGGPMGSMGPMGAGGNADAMEAMMADPKMIQTAMRMMRSMDPEAMTEMVMSSGMCKNRAQAEAMAKQMSGMSDAQMEMMVKMAGAVQGARKVGQRAVSWARQNVLLVGAIVVVLLALLLRWLGYM